MKNPANTSQILSGKYSSSVYDDFVVYSSDQAAAMDLLRIINSFPAPTWQSAQAAILANMAENETGSGSAYYSEGNFTRAEQCYSTALSDLNTALSDEQSYQTTLQDLHAGNMSARNAYVNAWASFFNGFSTLWVLLGIGWVLISIGYIIKVMRTRRPEAPPPA
jgi:tetratricopeptide (TPR) repeat protein